MSFVMFAFRAGARCELFLLNHDGLMGSVGGNSMFIRMSSESESRTLGLTVDIGCWIRGLSTDFW